MWAPHTDPANTVVVGSLNVATDSGALTPVGEPRHGVRQRDGRR